MLTRVADVVFDWCDYLLIKLEGYEDDHSVRDLDNGDTVRGDLVDGASAMTKRIDSEQAARDARTRKDKGAPPHWLRCEWYQGLTRCKLGDGHSGDCDFTKTEEAK